MLGQLFHGPLVQVLEVDLGQVHGRQRRAGDGVGDVGAQVGIQHGGAHDAKQRIELFFGIFAASKMPACVASTRYRTLSSMRRSEEHTSELQSLMRIAYAVFCLKKKKKI